MMKHLITVILFLLAISLNAQALIMQPDDCLCAEDPTFVTKETILKMVEGPKTEYKVIDGVPASPIINSEVIETKPSATKYTSARIDCISCATKMPAETKEIDVTTYSPATPPTIEAVVTPARYESIEIFKVDRSGGIYVGSGGACGKGVPIGNDPDRVIIESNSTINIKKN